MDNGKYHDFMTSDPTAPTPADLERARALTPCESWPEDCPFGWNSCRRSHACKLKADIATALAAERERAIEEAAVVAEHPIAALEAEHAAWRVSFGEYCAQPHDDEIDVRRSVSTAIRALSQPGGST